jgi:UDP-2,3-diacylglucosamine hydrolase
MSTLFISDLHLDDRRPAVTALFRDWLRREAKQADALYVLGDLFEAYIGDDDDAPLIATVADALREVAEAGVPVSFVHGNRDFLVGPAFAQRAGMTLLPDTGSILHGTPTLLLHGDTSASMTSPTSIRGSCAIGWQQQFLAQPWRAAPSRTGTRGARNTQRMDARHGCHASAVTGARRARPPHDPRPYASSGRA